MGKNFSRSEAERGITLLDALDDLAALEKAAKRDKPKEGYDRIVINVSVSSECEAGGEDHARIELDMATGRLLLPTLRDVIEREVAKIGVTP
jgi:hypothetical protein